MTETYLNTQSSLSMKGSGYYSAKTVGAKNAIDKTQYILPNYEYLYSKPIDY